MLRVPSHREPTHPGRMLREEFLEPFGLSQREFAQRLGISYRSLNELLRGRRGVTSDTALRLEQLLGVEAQFWLNLQIVWDLYWARRSPPARLIRRIARLPQLRRAS